MSISLNSSVRTCKVQPGYAPNIESDRYLNPDTRVCYQWNGFNSAGQEVCPDSWNTKAAGCNSAIDRVDVESYLRPNYSAYINFNMEGIQGDLYSKGNPTAWSKSGSANSWDQSRYAVTGSFGNQWQSTNKPSCVLSPYDTMMTGK
jgi:hypothetical protein